MLWAHPATGGFSVSLVGLPVSLVLVDPLAFPFPAFLGFPLVSVFLAGFVDVYLVVAISFALVVPSDVPLPFPLVVPSDVPLGFPSLVSSFGFIIVLISMRICSLVFEVSSWIFLAMLKVH